MDKRGIEDGILLADLHECSEEGSAGSKTRDQHTVTNLSQVQPPVTVMSQLIQNLLQKYHTQPASDTPPRFLHLLRRLLILSAEASRFLEGEVVMIDGYQDSVFNSISYENFFNVKEVRSDRNTELQTIQRMLVLGEEVEKLSERASVAAASYSEEHFEQGQLKFRDHSIEQFRKLEQFIKERKGKYEGAEEKIKHMIMLHVK